MSYREDGADSEDAADGVLLLYPQSRLARLDEKLRFIYYLMQSGLLVPDAIRKSPYTLPVCIVTSAVIAAAPRFGIYLMLIVAGALVGFVCAVPPLEVPSAEQDRRREAFLNKIVEFPAKLASTRLLSSMAKEAGKTSLPPTLDGSINHFLSRLIPDLIDPWYKQLCKSGQREFQDCVRSTVDAAVMTLVNYVRGRTKDSITLCLYGITNALIVHMQEFRDYEKSGLSLAQYLATNRTKKNYYMTMAEELEHLRQIAAVLLKRLLPRQEYRSICLNSLVKEIIASDAFFSLIDKISEPDFVNMQLIRILQDPTDQIQPVEKGWNRVVIKVIKGRNMPVDVASGGLYCIVHIAGRRIKTSRIKDSHQPLWNESFQFKISDGVREHLRIHIQLMQYSYIGKDASLGFVRIHPDFDHPLTPVQNWLRFSSARLLHDKARTESVPEVFVEVNALVGKDEPAVSEAAPDLPFRNTQSQSPLSTERPADAISLSSVATLSKPSDAGEANHVAITLDAALQNNVLFMEFHEFLDECKAPPYLQFLMNLGAYRQQTAIEIGVDPNDPTAIDEYFCSGKLTDKQVEQLQVARKDALDIYSSHFAENSRYRIPLDTEVQEELLKRIHASDTITPEGHLASGPVGPNLFIPAYRLVLENMDEIYFSKFKESEAFMKFLDRARFTTLTFTLEDDRLSTYSGDSSFPLAAGATHTALDQSGIPVPTIFEAESESSFARSRSAADSRLDDADDDLVASERLRAQTIESKSPVDEDYVPRQRSQSEVADRGEKFAPSNNNNFCDDPEMDMKKIATAITIHRQQIAVIDEALERSEASGSLDESERRSLLKSKSSLQRQIQSLLRLLESKGDTFDAEDFRMDLRNVSLRVKEVVDSSKAGENVLFNLWNTTMGAVLPASFDPIFAIEILKEPAQRKSNPLTLSVVTRAFSDFEKLHHSLRKQFPKISKIPFPSNQAKDAQGHVLSLLLESYLQLLVSDEFIRQSLQLREFVTLDGDLEKKPLTSSAGQFVETLVGRRMKDAFRTATNALTGVVSNKSNGRTRFYETRERHTTTEIDDRPSSSPVKSLGNRSSSSIYPGSVSGSPLLTTRTELGAGADGSMLPKAPVVVIEDLTDAEVEMLLETFFAFVIETFELREPNQWLRRKLVGVFKQIVKQAYGDALGRQLTDQINLACQEEALLHYLGMITDVLWPGGVFVRETPPPVARSEEQRLATMIEARTLFLRRTPDVVQNMTGRYNAVCGMTRIFNMLQQKDLNKNLLHVFVDIIIKLLFFEATGS